MLSIVDSKVTAKPNASLEPQGAMKLILALFFVSMLVCLVFFKLGAWLVLPFAGLELLALAYAFYSVLIRVHDYESIAIKDDVVEVVQCICGEMKVTSFQRYWTRIQLRDVAGTGRQGLFIGSHGVELEFAKTFIDDAQRADLSRQLKIKLKNN